MKKKMIGILMVISFTVQAANVWDGGGADDNWNTAANWDDNAVPSFPVGLNFGGTTRLTPNNDLSSLTVNGITFDSGAGEFVIGGNAITLGGDIVNNDNSAQTISLDMAMSATRTVTLTAGDIVLDGVLSGSGGLTMEGSKYLTLSGNNTFSGPVTLNSGTVKTGSDTAFGTGQVTFNGGKWNALNDAVITNNIAINATTAGNSLSRSTEFTGQLTGTGLFAVNGFSAGTVKLSGDNSGWSGEWAFQGENKLQLNHVNAIGTGATIGFDNVTSAGKSRGTLESLVALTGANALSQDITLGSNLYSNNTATIVTTADMELTGTISGDSETQVIKTGAGKLYLNGTNTYAGGTDVQFGIIVPRSDMAFGTGDVEFSGGKWNADGNVVISNNIILSSQMVGNSLSSETEFTGQISGTGDLKINGFASGVTTLSGDNSGWSGNWEFQGRNKLQLNHTNALGTGTTITFDDISADSWSRGELESLVDLTGANALSQDISLGVTAYSDNTATIRTTENMELTGVISGESGTQLIKAGTGKLFLGGTNTYEGGTLVATGIIIADSDAAFGTGDVEFDGGQWNSGNGSVISNNIILSSDVVGNSLSSATEFSGQLSGSGNLKIHGFASGIVTLSGDNSGWSGSWEFLGRNKLQLNHTNALGTGTTITFDDDTDADYSRGELESLVDLTGANALSQNISLGVTAYSNNSATIRTIENMELTGTISGEAGTLLIKAGTNVLTLSSANTYEGGTDVSEGTLVGNASGALGTGDVAVADGAALVLQDTAVINDAAAVVLGASSSLTLDFSGSETIGSLSLDGGSTTVSDGTYSAAALSGLGSGTYTGTGSLVVGTGGSAYDTWASNYGLTGGKTDDDDGDGLLNVYEYGLGGDPTNSADQGISPVSGIENVGGTNYFGYVHPQLHDPASGISYYLELNTNLVSGTWTNAGYFIYGTNVTGGTFDYVTNVTTTVEDAKFIRLIIE